MVSVVVVFVAGDKCVPACDGCEHGKNDDRDCVEGHGLRVAWSWLLPQSAKWNFDASSSSIIRISASPVVRSKITLPATCSADSMAFQRQMRALLDGVMIRFRLGLIALASRGDLAKEASGSKESL